jgi:sigma-B regulation protein RsbU (phosphoserine phosphatase)
VRVNATWYTSKPAAAIRDANTIISHDSKSGMFVTLFYGLMDSTSHTFTYVNAGHNPPIHYSAAEGTLSELEATGIAMGVLDNAQYTQDTVQMARGDLLILYTDGVTEAENAHLEMFGLDPLKKIILASHMLSSKDIIEEILHAVRAFAGDQPQSDDITLMVIRSL